MKVFIEEQRFNQWWLIVVLVIPFFAMLVPFLFQKEEINNDKETINSIFTILIILITAIGLILSIKLKTRIDEYGIKFRFFPFHFSNKSINWNEIKKVYVRKYNPILEYGGWGLKGGRLWNKSKGVAYNVKGDIGIQLELKNGKKILIGTQKGSDVERILQTYTNKIL